MTGVRPASLVLVVGTGTGIGKTWVSARLLSGLRHAGVTVAARKPAQSFDAADDAEETDAAVLGRATGEPPTAVCPPHRWYEVPMAPPMAAERLGRPAFTVAELAAELRWPDDVVEVGLVESAGGVRSPQAGDGDAVGLCTLLRPDIVLLVADAGLGTINSVRLTADVLPAGVIVVLNRYNPLDELHVRNRWWLAKRDGYRVTVLPEDERALLDLLCGPPASRI